MSSIHETTLEIDLQKLKHNYKFIQSKLNSKTKILGVVKAFAYGSDIEAIALCLQNLSVDYLAVAYTNEGIQLRKAGVTKPILVLHPQPSNFKHIIDHCLEPSIYSFKVLKAFIVAATLQNQKNYPIHLKFNTGLNRLGFLKEDISSVLSALNEVKHIKIASVFSHLAASNDLEEEKFTKVQIQLFKEIKADFQQYDSSIIYHLLNTSGILNYPEAHFDMVRTGIGLYGFSNSDHFDDKLKPIASLKSVVSQIHTLKKGDTLGYNRAFEANRITKTATIPIGHADGITRQYGNGNGFVIIANKKAFILGNVCMDMIMVDVTNINCEEGDEVIIYDGTYSAVDFSKTAGSISYEILTAASQRITRIIKE